MREYLKHYINGQWVASHAPGTIDVINPATEVVAGRIAKGSSADVNDAVAAARRAFLPWANTSREDRVAVLERCLVEYKRRYDDICTAVTEEMGAPATLSRNAQALMGQLHLDIAINVLKDYAFHTDRGGTRIAKEPIGVCALITPWNWPLNQVACKVAPALATGCTMVLKPSELSPFSAIIWAEILHAAGVPPGVFNLVNGTGTEVGAALSVHPDVDMVSFTGSTRAGIEVARNAAPTVKRVHQELGGKSPFIILDDANLDAAVAQCVSTVMMNSGQSCNAPTRMLVPKAKMTAAIAAAKATAEGLKVGDPNTDVAVGPVVSKSQWERIQSYIESGVAERATLVTGGTGRPNGLTKGYYVKPTVFANVTQDMRICREEIFGPVLSIVGYDTLEEAIRIANDTEYGLAAYISGVDARTLSEVASRLRAGQIHINEGAFDPTAPFGGYKRSGNGREWGDHAFAEYLETKAMIGFPKQPVAA